MNLFEFPVARKMVQFKYTQMGSGLMIFVNTQLVFRNNLRCYYEYLKSLAAKARLKLKVKLRFKLN